MKNNSNLLAELAEWYPLSYNHIRSYFNRGRVIGILKSKLTSHELVINSSSDNKVIRDMTGLRSTQRPKIPRASISFQFLQEVKALP